MEAHQADGKKLLSLPDALEKIISQYRRTVFLENGCLTPENRFLRLFCAIPFFIRKIALAICKRSASTHRIPLTDVYFSVPEGKYRQKMTNSDSRSGRSPSWAFVITSLSALRDGILARVIPAGFWANIALFCGFSSSATFLFRKNNQVTGGQDVRRVYAEAVAANQAGLHDQAFSAARQALLLQPSQFQLAALLLAYRALMDARNIEAADILVSVDDSYCLGLAVALLTLVGEIGRAVRLLEGHALRHPDEAEVAGDYLLLILNRRDEAARAYDVALEWRPTRAMRLKRAMVMPMYLSTEKEIAIAREDVTERLRHIVAIPSTPDASTYLDTQARIPMFGINADPLYPILFHGVPDVAITRMREAAFRQVFPELWETPSPIGRCEKRGGDIRLGLFTESMYPQVDKFWGALLEEIPDGAVDLTLFMPRSLPGDNLTRLKKIAKRVVEYPYPRATAHARVGRDYGNDAFPAAREIVASQELDVFYNLFVGQDMMAQYMSYFRFAPVQLADQSRMTTTGMREVDYYLMHRGDFCADPAEWFTEKIVLLGGITPVLSGMLDSPPEAAKLDRRYFGLPEDVTIYLCIQDISRKHPEMNPFLAELLKKDVDSLLIVSDFGTPGAMADFRNSLERQGVRRVSSRIRTAPIFNNNAPASHYYAFLHLADANLTFRRMCGGTPFYDHLALGIPQIVWPFEGIISSSAGLYRRMGMTELMAANGDEYVEKAYRLAHDKAWSIEMRMLLRERTKLFNDVCKQEDAPREFLQFLRDALVRADAGLAPAHWLGGKFHECLDSEQLLHV